MKTETWPNDPNCPTVKDERKPIGIEYAFREAGWTWEQIDAHKNDRS